MSKLQCFWDFYILFHKFKSKQFFSLVPRYYGLSLLRNCCPSDTQCATCTKTLAKNHRRLHCNSCSILHHNKCGQVKPTKFKRQFQSIITTWICPRCVTKSLLAELPIAGIGNTSCESLFLDEGEVKVRMYGEDFDSSQLSELTASELPDCEGIVVD